MNKLTFPQGFLWGSATAAHQVEGNNTKNDWWEWEHSERRSTQLKKQNKNPADYYSGIACDSYNRYEEDFDIAKSLNQNVHRFSIEWSRIEPEKGEFDSAEIEHYRKVLQALQARGIKTFVTLHHYTVPAWFSRLGGFEKRENVDYFLKFAGRVLKEYKNLVNFICVFNEPEVYANLAFMVGRYPPQKNSIRLYYSVLDNLAEAHRKTYLLAKGIDPTVPVGSAINIPFLNLLGVLKIFRGMIEKKVLLRFANQISKFSDYFGVQYYHKETVGLSLRFPFYKRYKNLKVQLTDVYWEIAPEGFFHILNVFKRFGKPIYVTENGVADARDVLRRNFIRDHLLAMHKAIQGGADVRGYMYWSLLDNFEWDMGYGPRFGLVEIDRENNLARKVRTSAGYFAEICKSNEIEPEGVMQKSEAAA